MRTQINTTQIKNKSKQSIKKKSGKNLMQRRVTTEKMTINDNKKKLKMKKLSSVTNWLVAKKHFEISPKSTLNAPASLAASFVSQRCVHLITCKPFTI
jgi:hypothetical protein